MEGKKVSMIVPIKFLVIAVLSFSLNVACGSKESGDGDPVQVEDFPASLLSTFASWSPVLSGDQVFASSGHAGQKTRVYFNEAAAPHFKGEKSLPFSVGSYVAKAVVASLDAPAASATRVYFMLKKASGFDEGNNDWSYAVSNLKDGKLEFDSSQGKLTSCIGCHAAEKKWDYVRTVDYFRKQSVQ